jgi:hypothetical protein
MHDKGLALALDSDEERTSRRWSHISEFRFRVYKAHKLEETVCMLGMRPLVLSSFPLRGHALPRPSGV